MQGVVAALRGPVTRHVVNLLLTAAIAYGVQRGVVSEACQNDLRTVLSGWLSSL